jgi:pimeloyl-ACP methyl ester carboxylesterase
MSALVSVADHPLAVLVALHGGAVTSAYFDTPAQPRLSLLRLGAALGFTVIALDRPGYGTSAPYAERMTTVPSRVDLAYAAVDGLLAGQSRGAGVFLMAHSMGCVLAVQMAAAERGAGLLGLEIAGIGRRPHPGAASLMGPPLRDGRRPVPAAADGATMRDVIWTPDHLYPAGAAAALPLSGTPGYEGDDVRGWVGSFPALAARVRIPVRYCLGDHEGVWHSGPSALADIASLFTASPRVVTAEQARGGHNLSRGLSAAAYHLQVLAFAEECALASTQGD